MHIGYLYVVVVPSGEEVPFQSEMSGTVKEYIAKQKYPVTVMNCDIFGRNLQDYMI